ncbi:transmembrane channel-like protein 7 isoform X2 [Daphnia pulicaria]|nr:transmembrane channel-like protein 7 isoform X2 [Daphnia pulicaria]
MTESSSIYSGCSGEKYNRASESRNGLNEAKEKHLHLQSTATTMCTTPGDDTKDDKKVSWETMLPSNRTTTIDVRTWGKTTSRSRRASTLRHASTPTDEVELGMMPDLSQGIPNEEEMWQKMQQIRSLPITMAEKRRLKAELKVAQNLRVHGLELIRFRRRQIWHRIHSFTMQIFSFFSPWKQTIRSIEANFGTGVASYFLLIRWQLLLNFLITLFTVTLILVPWEVGQVSCENLNLTLGQASCENKNRTDFPDVDLPVLEGCNRPSNHSACDDNCVTKTDECFLDYGFSVMCTIANHSSQPLLLIQDTVQGTGWLEFTVAFYGYYQPAFLPWGDDKVYNFALAYQLVVYFVLLFSLVCMAKSVATGFKDNIGLGRSWLHQFSDLAFTSWDYCIDSAKVAQLKKKAILHAFRVALADKDYANEKAGRNMREKINLFFLRLAVNILVMGTLSLAAYIIYLVTSFSEMYRNEIDQGIGSFKNVEDFRILMIGFLPSIVITALNFLVPMLFRAFVRFERFSATFEIKITLARTVLLRLASLLVLVLTLYSSLQKSGLNSSCDSDGLKHAPCWETYVGQQLYRLCIFDVFVTLFITLLIELPLSLIFRRSVLPTSRLNCIANPEFNLVGSTLDMVYSQSICWLGMFYCPVLPIITTVKCVIVFYVKYFSLLVYSCPPSRVYGASSSTSLFMNVLLVSFISCVLPLGYHVTSLRPSVSCGPFRGFDTVWSAISSEVETLSDTLKNILFFFGSAGFFVPAILILLVALYYYRSKAVANRAVVESLTSQLILEAEDKQFLITRLTAVGKQQLHV